MAGDAAARAGRGPDGAGAGIPARARSAAISKWGYDEDSHQRDEASATGSWWEALKYVPHADGDLHLTFGAELRARYEGYENDLWGSVPNADHDYTWLRALPYAELRTQVDVVLEFAPDRTFDMTLSWSTFWRGTFVRAAAADETVHFVSVEARFVF